MYLFVVECLSRWKVNLNQSILVLFFLICWILFCILYTHIEWFSSDFPLLNLCGGHLNRYNCAERMTAMQVSVYTCIPFMHSVDLMSEDRGVGSQMEHYLIRNQVTALTLSIMTKLNCTQPLSPLLPFQVLFSVQSVAKQAVKRWGNVMQTRITLKLPFRIGKVMSKTKRVNVPMWHISPLVKSK